MGNLYKIYSLQLPFLMEGRNNSGSSCIKNSAKREEREEVENNKANTIIQKKDISLKVIFAAQIGIIYIVAIVSLTNLTLKIGDSNLWVALLASSLGYILPAPTLRQSESQIAPADTTRSFLLSGSNNRRLR